MNITVTSTIHISDEEIVGLIAKGFLQGNPQSSAIDLDATMSREEAAAKYGVHKNTISKWCRQGKLRFKQMGRQVRPYVIQNTTVNLTANKEGVAA